MNEVNARDEVELSASISVYIDGCFYDEVPAHHAESTIEALELENDFADETWSDGRVDLTTEPVESDEARPTVHVFPASAFGTVGMVAVHRLTTADDLPWDLQRALEVVGRDLFPTVCIYIDGAPDLADLEETHVVVRHDTAPTATVVPFPARLLRGNAYPAGHVAAVISLADARARRTRRAA